MALPVCCLPVIKAILDGTPRPDAGGLRALSLGYPDLLASREQLLAIFGPAAEAGLRARGDSDAVNRWHGTSAVLPTIFDTTAFFGGLGVRLDCVDINPTRGHERVLDLNHPLPDDLRGIYYLVLDFGTLEHCFNVAQAMKNVAEALSDGGCVIHINPLNRFNHGFYNLNPTFYADFYAQNGFDLLYLTGLSGPVMNIEMFDLPPFERFKEAPRDSNVLVVARRSQPRAVVWPKQRKYQANPSLLG